MAFRINKGTLLRVAVVCTVILVIFLPVAFVFLFVFFFFLVWLRRRRTSAATDRSEGAESRHSGYILLMPNGTPWQTREFPIRGEKNCSNENVTRRKANQAVSSNQ